MYNFQDMLKTLSLWLLVSMQFLRGANSEYSQDPYRLTLSHGKPVIMSSTHLTHVGSFATDGNFNYNPPHDHCSKTTVSSYPYLQVDLETSQFVSTLLLVFPSTESKKPVFTDVRVTAGDDADVASTNNVILKQGDFSNILTISVKRVVRYFTIQRMAVDVYLGLCEVAAYLFPVENLAWNKKTRSSNSIPYKKPPRAVDWYLVTSIFLTTKRSEVWFQLDFEFVVFVHEVVLFAIVQLYQVDSYLVDSEMRIGNLQTERKNNALCSVVNMFPGEMRSFFCNIFGKHLFVLRETDYNLGFGEIIVNPASIRNIAIGKPVVCSFTGRTSNPCKQVNNGAIHSSVTERQVINGVKHISINLGTQNRITLVSVVNRYEFQNVVIRVGTSLENSEICDTAEKIRPTFSFFICPYNLFGTHVFFKATWLRSSLFSVEEIAVYSETMPVFKEIVTDNYFWIEENKEYTLKCNAKGYPTPVVSWLKNNELIKNNSDTLVLKNVQYNQSGEYYCVATNEHGMNGRMINITISTGIRVCLNVVENVETSKALNTFLTSINGMKWHSFYNNKSHSYLQLKESVPRDSSCNLWLNGQHPTLADGVVERSLCVKNATHDCSASTKIFIRRCASQYVYNFWDFVNKDSILCYERAPNFNVEIKPVLASPQYQHVLTDFVFHTEVDILHSYHCMMLCQLKAGCKSFNFSKELKLCQLNNATKFDGPNKFQFDSKYDYYSMNPGKAAKVDL